MKRLAIPLLMMMIMGTVHAQTKPAAGTKKAPAKPATAAKSKPAVTPAIKKEDIEEGKVLLSKSDCLACHKVDTRIVGPAYAEVAKKYPYSTANVDLLCAKIINGGSGTWGAVPMAAHPALAATDVKKMVTYILSLQTK
jgi:cytochrome c